MSTAGPPERNFTAKVCRFQRIRSKGVDLAGKSGCPSDIQSGNSICVFISTKRKELFGGIAC
jgi:hypothetical protein